VAAEVEEATPTLLVTRLPMMMEAVEAEVETVAETVVMVAALPKTAVMVEARHG
jgi:hypothetical protein